VRPVACRYGGGHRLRADAITGSQVGYDVDERAGRSGRLMWLLVTGLFAGICYSMGFNAGCDEGEGRLWRRQLQRMRDATQVQEVVDAGVELATLPTDAGAPLATSGAPPTDAEPFADILGRSLPPEIAGRASHDQAF
jgi:hypothetical protein